MINYLLNCLCLRKIKSNIKAYKNEFLYEKGKSKLIGELDVITLLKSIR